MNYIIPFHEILPAFCAQRCTGHPSAFGNTDDPMANPRIAFLVNLLMDLKIPYEIDTWTATTMGGNLIYFYNLYLRGTSDKIITAHHDIVNIKSDNCNDNSASCINAIAAKILNPEVTVVITDCEEFGGKGAQRLCDKIQAGEFGTIDYVVNLELTAVGGMNFFTEPILYSRLYKKIMNLFPATPTMNVPFHDGIIMRRNNIDCLVINPLPLRENGKLNYAYLNYCHSIEDSINLANYQDMDDFVKHIVTPLVK